MKSTSSNRARSSTWRSVAVLGVAAAGGWILLATGPTTAPEEKTAKPRSVLVQSIEPADHRIRIRANGTVVPARKVIVHPQVTGEVIRHHPELIPGGTVAEGEELFAIDPTLAELSLREDTAAVARAQASLTEARRKRDEALELARELVIAGSELAALESAVSIQKAELERLQVAVSRTRELLIRHSVRAPFNAIVLDEFVEIGQRVNPSAAAATLAGADEFWVRVALPTNKLRWVRMPRDGREGASADVYLETGDAQLAHWEGKVIRLLGELESTGRMARVLVRIRDPFDLDAGSGRAPMLLGSYVRVDIDAGELSDVLAIQRDALREGDQIWVVDADGTLQIRGVEVVWREQETVYVRNVMKPGESLIVSSLRVALPGMKVTPQFPHPTATDQSS